MVCEAKRCFYVIEQPQGSLLQCHPGFERMLRRIKLWRVHVQMKDYGAASQKSTWLYSGHKDIEDLEKFKPILLAEETPEKVQLCNKHEDKNGRTRVSGNANLKLSQSYPPRFPGCNKPRHLNLFLEPNPKLS
jgi:hypothetical protein